ncbi:MFS transporter [Pontivivens insulae]|uniref:Inner membrane protein YbjJ n=1 Tax=Pontivivens insulae TaxID=1639689 RepID=A0A2R8ABE7_9RHOB|nr:MFS transporter [Pontivivens insulae]RED11286.1 sugar phosphate permease [Pontivivens insulae]SPF29541.1 Inner membrane protein YbjJ [Pontivivens insulae]
MSAEPTGLRAALLYFGLNGAMFGTWISRIPDVKADLGLSEGELGLLLLCMAIGAVVSFTPAARLAEVFGAARVSGILALLMAVSLTLLSVLPGAWALGVGLLIFGSVGGSMDLTMNSYGSEVEARAKRSRMSLMHGCWSGGFALAAWIGAAATGAQATLFTHFVLISALALAVGSWARANDVASPPADPDTPPAPKVALPRGAMIAVATVNALAFVIEGSILDWGAIHVRETLGGTAVQGSWALSVFATSMLAIRLCGDALIDRFGRQRMALIAGLLTASGLVTMVVLSTPLGVTISLAVCALGMGLIVPLAFSRAGKEKHPSRAIAAVALFGYGGLLTGPVIMGAVGEFYGLTASFTVMAVMAVVILLLSRRLA